MYGYGAEEVGSTIVDSSKKHVISELCNSNAVLESWIRLERDTISVAIDSILAEPNAFEPRYKGAADVDKVHILILLNKLVLK